MNEDPAAVVRVSRPYTFEKLEDRWEVHLDLPFASKAEVGLFKKGDELVVEIGTLRRHIGLPTSMAALEPSRARLQNGKLVVELRER
jgi:arsenite-transporting ATPase